VPGALTTIAYLVVLLVAALLIAALTAGLVRLARSGTPRPGARFTRGETAVGTPAEPTNVAGQVR
jgi:hypothetical protein